MFQQYQQNKMVTTMKNIVYSWCQLAKMQIYQAVPKLCITSGKSGVLDLTVTNQQSYSIVQLQTKSLLGSSFEVDYSSGMTAREACDDNYELYGRGKAVTYTIDRLRKAKYEWGSHSVMATDSENAH